MANVITLFRIVYSVIILFVQPFSAEFYILYVTAGVSDMSDGFVARKTNTQSEFGAKLDSVSDIVFVGVCLFKLLPLLEIHVWTWAIIALIATVRIVNILSGVIILKKVVMLHTVANKTTGALLFLLPVFVRFVPLEYLVVPVLITALFASIQEGRYIRTKKTDIELIEPKKL